MAVSATIPNRSIPIATFTFDGRRYDMPLNEEWARFFRDIQVRSGGVTGVTPATSGGTGYSSYTVGDILYADTSASLARLNIAASGNALLSGAVPSWGKIGLTTHVSGVLPEANGGTGFGAFGAGISSWLQDPTSAKLKTAVTDETGSGPLVFANSPALVTPDIGAPSAGNLSNCTGFPASGLSGTVTVAQGGTGITSGTSGGIPYYSSSSTIASSAALTANALTLGGGAGAAPASLGSLGTTTTVLHGNAAGAPTFGQVSLTTTVSGILPPANGGTGVANNAASTIAISGAFASTFTITGVTSVTFPTSGTLATTAQLPAGANPSASVGLAAVNGSAATFMRSDGAPALSVAISPTWTGVHTFQPSSGAMLWDSQITSAGAPVYARIGNGSNAASSAAVLCLDASANGFGVRDCQVRATNDGGNALTLSFWTANGAAPTSKLEIGPTGQVALQIAGRGLSIKEGANAKQGTATLVAGAVTVANTSVTANSRIFLTSQVDGGTPGFLRVSARIAATSFTITSSSATDTSTVAYFITEPS
jgi:hypothetical protein